MEQKKTLWIVAAAGIFLLVVIGAALIIYSPSLHNSPVQQASFDPSTGWVNATALSDSQNENSAATAPVPDALSENQNSESNLASSPFDPLAQNQTPQNDSGNFAQNQNENSASSNSQNQNPVINAQNVNVYAQETTTFDLNALKAASANSGASNSNVTAQNEKTAEQLAKANESKSASKTTQENYYTPAPSASKSTSSAKSSSASTSSAKTASKSSAAKTTASKKTETAKKVAEVAKTPSNLYWVQVGAYSSKKNADSARATLEENKIPVEVFTEGKYYKVRAGSFTTKSEAIYWQKMISEIGRFADSKTMVVNSSIQK